MLTFNRVVVLAVVAAALLGLLGGTGSARADNPSDGCSVPTSIEPFIGDGDVPFGRWDFSAACAGHDTCYSTWANFGSFDSCNEQFKSDLSALCDLHQGLSGWSCDRVAALYFRAVEAFGFDDYQRQQEQHRPASAVAETAPNTTRQVVGVDAGDYAWVRFDLQGGELWELEWTILGGNGDVGVHIYFEPIDEFIYSVPQDMDQAVFIEDAPRGTYWLLLDNRFSFFTKKTVTVLSTITP